MSNIDFIPQHVKNIFFDGEAARKQVSKFGFIDPKPDKTVTDIIFPGRTLIPFTQFRNDELQDYIGEKMRVDIECYRNYFLIMFKHKESGKVIVFEDSPDQSINLQMLAWCLQAYKIETFNGNNYDIPMINLALKGYRREELKTASDLIIVENFRPKDLYDAYRVEPIFLNHVDIIEVCPLNGSLKKYAGRLHAKRMQELPYEPSRILTQHEALEIKHYCNNDEDNTILVSEGLSKQLQLREALSVKYKQDLRSKSDAQIAEAAIVKEVEKILGRKVKRPSLSFDYTCQYTDPSFIKFKSPKLQQVYKDILDARFSLDGAGSPMMARTLGVAKYKNGKETRELKVRIGQTDYKLGMGGIHSCEKSTAFLSDDEYILLDRDVASYYPRIILNQKLFPKQLTEAFLTVYEGFVNDRLAAKGLSKSSDLSIAEHNKIAADSLKIVINGGFGKFGSMYSDLYSPDLMLQVTLTGQLCLLMLIEMLESVGIQVVSANTDGLVSRVKRAERHVFENIIAEWERITNFETEETGYAALYSKDVNNYIALKYKQDKKTKEWLSEIETCKVKGAYSDPWTDKEMQIFRYHINPTFQICTQAICTMLKDGVDPAHTIRSCRDITRFIAVRDVKGGAHKDRLYIGKFIRWYMGKNAKGTINYILSNNKVPETEGAVPCMDLPDEFPSDINYDWYIRRVESMLVDIGYYKPQDIVGQSTFF